MTTIKIHTNIKKAILVERRQDQICDTAISLFEDILIY